ncbi:EamA family transporter [Nocardia sp. NPDC049190]|uniref:DMT family transporter n=1 Tax=Nocardia sp. NPDC049190 TaxID=3155650 RepID=UPI0033C608AD
MIIQKNGTTAGAGLVLGAALLWGTVGPAQVLADSPLGTAALGGWRMLVGGVVLWTVTARDLTRLRAVAARSARPYVLMCALSTCVYQAAFLYAVSRTGAALATVIALGTAPVTTGVAARWVTGERVRAAWLVSTGAAVAGCTLLMTPVDGHSADPLGLLLGVVAGACYGLYTVCAKRLAADNPTMHLPTLSAVSLTVGAVILLPWMLAETAGLSDTRTLGLIAWLSLATTVAAYWLFSAGLTRMSAATVGTLGLAEPLTAALLGVLVLDEHLSPTDVVGCALMVGGLTAVSLPVHRNPRGLCASPSGIQVTPVRPRG